MRRVGTQNREKCVGKRASAPKIPPTCLSKGTPTVPKDEIKFFVLDRDTMAPVLCKDFREWANFMQPRGKILAEKRVYGIVMCIIFLGYSYCDPPLLFEVVTYGGDDDGRRFLFEKYDDACAYFKKTLRAHKYAHEKEKTHEKESE